MTTATITLDDIVDATSEVEQCLMQLGGEGRGMHEKLSTVTVSLPHDLVKQIRYLATTRNRRMHESRDAIVDPEAFIRQCSQVSNRLRMIHAERSAPQPYMQSAGAVRQPPIIVTPRVDSGPKVGGFNAGLAVLIMAGFVGFGIYSANSKRKPVPVAPASAVAMVPQAPVEQATPPKKKPVQPKQAQPKKTPAAQSGEAEQAPQTTKNTALASVPLALSDIKLHRSASTFDKVSVSARVVNQTDKTISSARIGVRLFINGEAEPIVTDTLFMYLGQHGLRAGESKMESMSPRGFTDRQWSPPDVMNASAYRLELTVKEYEDGLKNSQTVSSPVVVGEHSSGRANVAAARQGTGTPTVSNPRLSFDNFFNHALVSVKFVNNTGVTLSSARVATRLFINGDGTPLASGRRGYDTLYLHFGAKGLAPGASAEASGTIRESLWATPDVRNATLRRVEVGLMEYTDGRNRSTQVASGLGGMQWN